MKEITIVAIEGDNSIKAYYKAEDEKALKELFNVEMKEEIENLIKEKMMND